MYMDVVSSPPRALFVHLQAGTGLGVATSVAMAEGLRRILSQRMGYEVRLLSDYGHPQAQGPATAAGVRGEVEGWLAEGAAAGACKRLCLFVGRVSGGAATLGDGVLDVEAVKGLLQANVGGKCIALVVFQGAQDVKMG